MKAKQYLAKLFLLFTFFSLPSHSMGIFNEGEEFRRTKSDSPVFLRYSNKITVTNFGLNLERAGFNIYTYDDIPAKREKIGYATYSINTKDDIVEISWVKINDDKQRKGYATEALQTLINVMKKKNNSHFSNVSSCFLCVGKSKLAMEKVAKKLGFMITDRFFCPEEINNFILPIKE